MIDTPSPKCLMSVAHTILGSILKFAVSALTLGLSGTNSGNCAIYVCVSMGTVAANHSQKCFELLLQGQTIETRHHVLLVLEVYNVHCEKS